ncbi:unnamed protein product [Rotaria magnacalcarata]|uniref:E3 ubiquitin-protein ligase RNF34 n=1 Tax=Rotaria magnacalcarata TaxID=392030 RepID=A0A814TAZ8_9BILA|nr:unnamed protein product [Rotaria magnacalcarata]
MPTPSLSSTASNDQCEHCHSTYSILRKKKLCVVCRQNYCGNCAPRDRSDSSSYRICVICQSISNNVTTREQLLELKVKYLRNYLDAKDISHNTCTEKRDLVDLIINNRHKQFSRSFIQQSEASPQTTNRNREQSSASGPFSNIQQTVSSLANQVNNFASNLQDYVSTTVSDAVNQTLSDDQPSPRTSSNRRTSSNVSSSPTSASQTTTNRPPSTHTQQTRPQPSASAASASSTSLTDQRARRKSLSEINHEDNIEDLNIRQLKELLAANFVDYKGCIERSELIDRVRRLYRDRQNEKLKTEQLDDTTACDSELCKICMDAIVDCVFLDCGHMVTCVKCGKLLAECPICRSNIVRVVRVFKS